MTVSTTANVITYAGNGATVTFSFAFPAVAASDLVVMTTTAGVTSIQPTANYTVTLNAASGTNPTAAGGSITMNSAPALGTSLTIERLLPVTQSYSFANQGTLYQPTIEQALDYQTMVNQQMTYTLSLCIQGPPTDPAGISYVLPSASLRAGLYAGFDSNGNVIAIAGTTSTNPVSSTMTPFVEANSLASARTILQLGTVAVENIGQGLADNGSGSLQVVYTPVADSTGQTVTLTYHLTQRFATGALTYTLPRANTLFSGFGFYVTALTGSVTFSINAADKFSGGATGTSMIIPPGSYAYVTTDAATNGTWYIQLNTLPGMTEPLNAQLSASVSANALTINLLDRNGNTPSTASPVFISFRDPTLTGGDLVYLVVTSALSIVIPNTATLGTVSAQANRLWVGIFNNAGTPVLGVYNCLNSTGPTLLPWDETTPVSGTAVIAGSNSAQTWYTASAVTSKSFRILGFVESTQTVAGTWAASPTRIQMFGPGVKKPGDIVQTQTVLSTTQGSSASATYVALSGPTLSITPTNAANLVDVCCYGTGNSNGTNVCGLQLLRGATAIGNQTASALTNGAYQTMIVTAYDLPNSTSSVTYSLQGKNSSGGASNFFFTATGYPALFRAQEIQI